MLALHAHPDDEAIFTGITFRRLAESGARVVLVLATSGELGSSRVPLRPGETVAARRTAELERSAALLGVSRLVLLGRRDSGLPGWQSGSHHRALARSDLAELGHRVAAVAIEEAADTLIFDDDGGLYGHPDHQASNQVGMVAAALTGAASYRVTVDRDRLARRGPHRHLIHGAAQAGAVGFGRPSRDITLAVRGEHRHLTDKRAAILAHVSQVGSEQLPIRQFAAAYGTEWYRHSGPRGALHQLTDIDAEPAPLEVA